MCLLQSVFFFLLLGGANGDLSWRCTLLTRFSRPSFFGGHAQLPEECLPKTRIGALLAGSSSSSSSSTSSSSSSSTSSSSATTPSSSFSSSSPAAPLFAFAASSSLPSLKVPPVVISSRSPKALTLENGFIKLKLNLEQGTIDALGGAFEGNGEYVSVISDTKTQTDQQQKGFRTEIVGEAWKPSPKTVRVVNEATENITLVLTDEQTKQEVWTVQLLAGQRVFTLKIESEGSGGKAKNFRHSFYTDPLTTYAFFENAGVVQMMDSPNFLASRDRLALWYAISGTSGTPASAQLRVVEGKVAGVMLENTACCDPRYKTGSVDIEQAFVTEAAKLLPFHSAINLYPLASPERQNWGPRPTEPGNVGEISSFSVTYEIGATDGNFPTHSVPSATANLPATDLRGYLTGVYSAAVGAIRSFDHPGMMTPTIWRPEPSYEGSYNFFDPDCFLALSAVIYSNDPYLQNQARLILEQTVKYIRADGLMPHHLDIKGGGNIEVTYNAISGATQPGPNIFWTMACLQYVNATGDVAWLQRTLPLLTRAVDYVLALIPAQGLVNAPGPLMIDTLIRTGYTADTNAALVWLLQHLIPTYVSLGNQTAANRLKSLKASVTKAMNQRLWDTTSSDHYVTSIDPKTNAVIDMVDYDANLIAVAAGISDAEQSKAILKRIDKGECSHAKNSGRGTWVSEKPYDSSKVYRGDTGDSFKMLARIAWFDGHARKRMGDKDMFDRILDPIVKDLLEFLWLNERYNCEGKRTRGYGFIFYPSVAAMLLREVRYGIRVGLSGVEISPFEKAFSFHVGNVHVDYSRTVCRIELLGNSGGGSGSKQQSFSYRVLLNPSTSYSVKFVKSPGCEAKSVKSDTDEAGILTFSSPDRSCVVEITAR